MENSILKRTMSGLIIASMVVSMFSFSLLIENGVYAAKKTKLNKKKVTITVGKTYQLKVKNKGKKKIKWSSSKKSVVTVSKKGKLKARKAGKATVTAKIGKKKFKCKVTVKKKKISTKYELNTQHIILYAINDEIADLGNVTLPSNLPTTFQLKVNGKVRSDLYFEVKTNNGWVSSGTGNGFFRVKSNGGVAREDGTFYNTYSYGTREYHVMVEDEGPFLPFKVTILDYSKILSESIIDSWLSGNINDSMTSYEKVTAIGNYVGSFDYGGTSDGVHMPIIHQGTCWAASSLTASMLQKAGFRVGIQYGGIFAAPNSNHRVAIVDIDGTLYEVESTGILNGVTIYSGKTGTYFGEINWWNGYNMFAQP